MDPILGNRGKRRLSVRGLTISINGKTYRIYNLNEYGVGFLIDSPEEIQIGTEIEPIIFNGNQPLRVAGIPRHISQFKPPDEHLLFKSGWVCGTEFTPENDLDGRKLLQEFIAEYLDSDSDESEK
jgi:hypothetical protein